MSSDDWVEELVNMQRSLQDRNDAEYKGVFYTVGYDSPCKYTQYLKKSRQVVSVMCDGDIKFAKQAEVA